MDSIRQTDPKMSQKIAELLGTSESAITNADIDKFVAKLTSKLAKNTDYSTRRAIIIDGFNDNELLKRLQIKLKKSGQGNSSIDSSRSELLSGILSFRKAVIERLKKYLVADEVYFVEKVLFRPEKIFSGIGEPTTYDPLGNTFTQITDEQGKPHVHREQNKLTIDDNPIGKEAFIKLISLNPHPNIMKYKRYDPSTNTAIADYRPIKDLGRLKSGELSITDILHLFIDYINVLDYLVDNDLVLQDISPDQLSYETLHTGKHAGVIEDLEGIYVLNQSRKGRICKTGFLAPEVQIDVETPITMDEMVYQLGKSLEMIFFHNSDNTIPQQDFSETQKNEVFNRIRGLVKSMTMPDPKQRIKLHESSGLKNQLNEIMLEIEAIKTKS